jgi:hypothetical protein
MRLLMVTTLSALCAGSAFAQEAPLAKVYACAGIAGAQERLACFDAAVAGLKQAEASGGVTVVTPEKQAAAAKQTFGFGEGGAASQKAQAAAVGIAPPPAEPDVVSVSIVEAVKARDGRHRFTLSNGQVWEQVETDKVQGLSGYPVPAEIRKAALGSFMMKVKNGRGFRVRRIS